MQTSWRTDADKLTFIACRNAPEPVPTSKIEPESPHGPSDFPHVAFGCEDAPHLMIGDVNLFLNPDDEDDEEEGSDDDDKMIEKTNAVIGEVEIMIASKAHQGKGLGREILQSTTVCTAMGRLRVG
jgi:hypothetical protein